MTEKRKQPDLNFRSPTLSLFPDRTMVAKEPPAGIIRTRAQKVLTRSLEMLGDTSNKPASIDFNGLSINSTLTDSPYQTSHPIFEIQEDELVQGAGISVRVQGREETFRGNQPIPGESGDIVVRTPNSFDIPVLAQLGMDSVLVLSVGAVVEDDQRQTFASLQRDSETWINYEQEWDNPEIETIFYVPLETDGVMHRIDKVPFLIEDGRKQLVEPWDIAPEYGVPPYKLLVGEVSPESLDLVDKSLSVLENLIEQQ